jgi:hypothetical protein
MRRWFDAENLALMDTTRYVRDLALFNRGFCLGSSITGPQKMWALNNGNRVFRCLTKKVEDIGGDSHSLQSENHFTVCNTRHQLERNTSIIIIEVPQLCSYIYIL